MGVLVHVGALMAAVVVIVVVVVFGALLAWLPPRSRSSRSSSSPAAKRAGMKVQLLLGLVLLVLGLAAGGSVMSHGWASSLVNAGMGSCLVAGMLLLVRLQP